MTSLSDDQLLELVRTHLPWKPGSPRACSCGWKGLSYLDHLALEVLAPYIAEREADSIKALLDVLTPELQRWEETLAGEDFLVAVGQWAEAHPELAHLIHQAHSAASGFEDGA